MHPFPADECVSYSQFFATTNMAGIGSLDSCIYIFFPLFKFVLHVHVFIGIDIRLSFGFWFFF